MSKSQKATQDRNETALAQVTPERRAAIEAIVESQNEPAVQRETAAQILEGTPTTLADRAFVYGFSLRKLATALDVNYNMVLKASKAPVPGVAYDPDTTNWVAVETYLVRKMGSTAYAGINWDTISEAAAESSVKLPAEWSVGTALTLRGDEETYALAIITATHVVLLPLESTQPRVMSIPTFMHQGPKEAK